MPLKAGSRLGPYEVLAPLGAGGMGEVYRARDTRLERSVALKVLPESLSVEHDRLERFEKEARSASALNHPNIVTIYDVGTLDGVSYIAMELVEGKTLRELLHTGPLPLRRLLPLAAQLADGLAKAHEAGIVHRDLKPENVMMTKDGLVEILDFGLAKLTQSGEESGEESELRTMTKATEPGTILGTVGYMSPEQASGLVLDARSDQFSLGSILYEMATGRKAFEHETKMQTLSAIITDEPEAIAKVNPKLPAHFCWIVERCLAKEPEGRYASTMRPRAGPRHTARPLLGGLFDRRSQAPCGGGRDGSAYAGRSRGARRRRCCSSWRGVGSANVEAFSRHRFRASASSRSGAVSSRAPASLATDRRSSTRRAGTDGRARCSLTEQSTVTNRGRSGSTRRRPGAISSAGELAVSIGMRGTPGRVLWDPRPRSSGGRRPAGAARRRHIGRLVAGWQGSRRRPRRQRTVPARSIRSARSSTSRTDPWSPCDSLPKGDLLGFARALLARLL